MRKVLRDKFYIIDEPALGEHYSWGDLIAVYKEESKHKYMA